MLRICWKMKSLYLNKRGQSISPTVKLILGLVVLGVLVYFLFFGSNTFSKTVKYDCAKDLNGRCSSIAFQCLENEIQTTVPNNCLTCCISKDSTKPDSLCADKIPGDPCGPAKDYNVCSESRQCQPKCEYCNSKPEDPKCKNILNDKQKKIDFRSGFSCSCTLQECNNKLDDGTCVKKFCSGSNYCCVK